MVIKSFAKINLSLSVNKRLKNGLHNIQSYYCLINLSDKIEISKIESKKDKIQFIGKFKHNINKNDNSIIKVLKILRKKKLISNYYKVIVKKEVPVFAGLGGGTSNAAFLASYLLKKKYNQPIISAFEKKIGTDIKLFSHSQGFLKDLKTLNSLKKKYNLYFLLVYPNIKCSSRFIFSKVKNYSKKFKHVSKKINTRFKFLKFLSQKNNDLQSIVEKRYFTIKKLIQEIEKKQGCCFSRMTGSGSVCYGVFLSKKTAKSALKIMKLKFPKYWVSIAKTI